MKLLVVDHNALEPANRVLYEKIVEQGGIDLRLIVPSWWHNTFQMLHFDPPKEKLPYELFSSSVVFPSRTHRLMYLSLHKHLNQFQPDVLYMNAEPENFQTYEAALLTKSSRTKLVFSSWRNIDHSHIGYPYQFEFLHKAIERYVLSRASHGIVFSRAAKFIFEKNGFRKTTLIPPPVDTSVFKPSPLSDFEKKNFVVGYIGRLVREKGVDLLLQAMTSLPNECSALIIGSGPATQELQALSRELNLDQRVTFRDAVSPSEIPHLLTQMDLLVLPSQTTPQWKEQFGRILIEAMACGVPVIGSSAGEIPNVIEDAGLIFKEGSVEGLRLGIERLMQSSSLRAGLHSRGMEKVNALYSLQVVAKQYHTLFTSL